MSNIYLITGKYEYYLIGDEVFKLSRKERKLDKLIDWDMPIEDILLDIRSNVLLFATTDFIYDLNESLKDYEYLKEKYEREIKVVKKWEDK